MEVNGYDIRASYNNAKNSIGICDPHPLYNAAFELDNINRRVRWSVRLP